jgi:hypothetical protein
MKSNVSRIFALVAITLVALCASANSATAQAFKGTFTLPEETRWNNVALPAGDYSFVLQSSAMPARISLDGPNGGAFILTSASDRKDSGQSSVMTIEHRGGACFVTDIYLADLGLHLRYKAPKLPRSERELAKGPVSTEQVLIASARN